jgi:hypothetical protein
MKKHFGLLAMLILATLPCAAQTLKLYDNFSGPFISPSKWSPQWQCGGTVMECVREIQEDKLRLRVRAYGASDTNDGAQFGSSGLSLVNNSVTDIAADLVVLHSAAQACSANPGFGGGGHAQVLLFGSFFNGGAGTSDDDVQAYLQLDHYATLQGGMVDVGGFLFHQGFFGNVDLGLVNVGERVRVELVWDKPNHRFVVRLFRPLYRTTTEQFMPYTISDTTAAVSPSRSIDANVFPANCAGTRKSAELEVLFDDVLVR